MENTDTRRFRVVQYEEQYFDELKNLVRVGWNPNHVLLKSDDLFRWHYTGFGQKAGMHFPLLFDGDKMIGFHLHFLLFVFFEVQDKIPAFLGRGDRFEIDRFTRFDLSGLPDGQ